MPKQDLFESPETLWRTVKNMRGSPERINALFSLYQLRDPKLSDFVVEELSLVTTEPDCWSDELIRIAERIDFSDPEKRERLASALLKQALARSEHFENSEPLFAALRRWGSIVPTRDVRKLKPFLQSSCSQEVKQLCLQIIQNMFEFTFKAAPLQGHKVIRDLCHEIALEYLTPERVKAVPDMVVGMNALLAVAAFGDGRLYDLISRVFELGNVPLIRVTFSHLSDMLASCTLSDTKTKKAKSLTFNINVYIGKSGGVFPEKDTLGL